MVPLTVLLDDQADDIAASVRRLRAAANDLPGLYTYLQRLSNLIYTLLADNATLDYNAHCDGLLYLATVSDERGDLAPLLRPVLTCACMLGELVRTFELQESTCSDAISFSVKHAIGISFGLLPAVALVVSSNSVDLHKFSLETIGIAFRLSSELQQRARLVEETNASWGFDIGGDVPIEEIQGILDKFHREKGVPSHRKTYTAIEEPGWTTIFGSPSDLAELLAFSADIAAAPRRAHVADSPLHAPHLPHVDLDGVIGSSLLLKSPIRADIQLLGLQDTGDKKTATFGTLMRNACFNIAQEKLDFSNILMLAQSIGSPQHESTILIPEASYRTEALQRVLQQPKSMTGRLLDTPASFGNDKPSAKRAIAIVGMAGRFPGSNNIPDFWQSLLDGKDLHQKVPEDRFDLASWMRSTDGRAEDLPYGCFLNHPEKFDNHLFNISPREAAEMDPDQRLLLTVSYEALQMAGYSPGASPSTSSRRIATYIGQASDDWRDITFCSGDIDLHYVPAHLRPFGPGRINYHYKWEGASYSIDSACSSSNTAIGLACSALHARDCDTALAGGANILCSPPLFRGLQKGGFLSPTGQCKTFQAGADGYCRGEGVGLLLLKRHEDALRDNDNVLALITGHARNHSAHTSSITHPHIETQERLFHQTLLLAGVSPDDVDYVEMHGTGTQAGDYAEMTSVHNVFGASVTRSKPLVLGAVKANVGHGEAAAGVISVIKAIMALQSGKIPPQPGMPFNVNPKLHLANSKHLRIADGKIGLPANPRQTNTKVMVNNFDAAGGNSCLLIESVGPEQPREEDPRGYHIVAVSAKTLQSLKQNKKRLLEYVTTNSAVRIADLCYTTTARSMHERLRKMYVTQSLEDLRQQLRVDISAEKHMNNTRRKKPTVAFVFTGVSSQYAGMGSQLFQTNSKFRGIILSMQKLCDWLKLPSFVEIIANPKTKLEEMTTTQVHLAIVALELGLVELWKSWGIRPDVVIGHSLGEYAALCVAGVLSVSDTLTLVGIRGKIIERRLIRDAYAMLSVSTAAKELQRSLQTLELGSCNIACLNASDFNVASGSTEDIMALQKHYQAKGVKTKRLGVPYGYHSVQFEPVGADLVVSADWIRFRAPKIPVASVLLGEIVRQQGTFSTKYLARQARNPVDFVGAVNACESAGIVDDQTLWLEMGPEAVCTNFVKHILHSETSLPTLSERQPGWKTVCAAAAMLYESGANLNLVEYHKEYVRSLRLLSLPTYAFDEGNFWNSFRAMNSSEEPPMTPLAAEAKKLSMTLHRVESCKKEGDKVTADFSSRVADPELFAAINGHKIDKVALCPASVFCDMAFTAGVYIARKANPDVKEVLEIRSMNMRHPVVVREPNTMQTILVHAHRSSSSMDLSISFSCDKKDAQALESGDCHVALLSPGDASNQLTETAFFITARMDSVTEMVLAGDGHHLKRPVLYKLFAQLVQYSDSYQAIDEVYWHDVSGEVVAKVTLKPQPSATQDPYSPYWLDAMMHLAGFILNGALDRDPSVVFVCNGFGRLRLFDELSSARQYRAYARRHETDQSGVTFNDVYMFEQDKLVAVCLRLKFQRMPKTTLLRLLGEDGYGQSLPASRHKADSDSIKPMSNGPLKSTTVAQKDTTHAGWSNASIVDTDPQAEDNPNKVLLRIIAAELNLEPEAIVRSSSFADLGVDSLVGIAILGDFKKVTGHQLGASFFLENPTVADASKALAESIKDENAEQVGVPVMDESLPAMTNSTASNISSDNESRMTTIVPNTESTSPHTSATEGNGRSRIESKAVLLHDRVSHKLPPLFLVADGAGSATAYLDFPRLRSKRPIYALDSPYLNFPELHESTVEEVARIYIDTIKMVQPSGPYSIGGWSAGGVHAYEIVRQLIALGDIVRHLIILDMHVPKPAPDGQEITMDFVDKIGVARRIEMSPMANDPVAVSKLKQHLLKTISSLVNYRPLPLASTNRPEQIVVIWAEKGMSEVSGRAALSGALNLGLKADIGADTMDEETDLISWFFSKRHSFGSNGWDKLTGPLSCHQVDADHFSIMKPPAICAVAKILQEMSL